LSNVTAVFHWLISSDCLGKQIPTEKSESTFLHSLGRTEPVADRFIERLVCIWKQPLKEIRVK